MILSDLKDRVFRLTNDTYHDQFHMRDLINGALTILSKDAKLEGKVIVNVVPGNANYELPSGYKSVRALIDEECCQSLDIITIDENRCGFAIWNGELILKPIPSESKNLTFYFYKFADQLEDDEDQLEPAFASYENVIASYAAAMILSLPGTNNANALVDRYFSIWENGRQQFKVDRAKQGKQATVRLTRQW